MADHVNSIADMTLDQFPKLSRALQHGDNFEQMPDFKQFVSRKVVDFDKLLEEGDTPWVSDDRTAEHHKLL